MFMLDGLHTGNGGGDHVTLGGSTLAGRVLRFFLAQVERALRRQCPGAGAKARTGAVVLGSQEPISINRSVVSVVAKTEQSPPKTR